MIIISGKMILFMIGTLMWLIAIGLVYLWWCLKNNWGDKL